MIHIPNNYPNLLLVHVIGHAKEETYQCLPILAWELDLDGIGYNESVAYLTFAKPVTCIPRPPVYGIYDSKTDHIYFINDNSIVASFDVPTLSLTETLTYLRKSADDGA